MDAGVPRNRRGRLGARRKENRRRTRDFSAVESIPPFTAYLRTGGRIYIYLLDLRVRHTDRFDREKSTHVTAHELVKAHLNRHDVTRLLRTGKHTSEIPVTPLPRTDAQMAEGNAHWFARDPSDSGPAGGPAAFKRFSFPLVYRWRAVRAAAHTRARRARVRRRKRASVWKRMNNDKREGKY